MGPALLGLGLLDFATWNHSPARFALPGSEGSKYDSKVCFDKDLKYSTFSTLAGVLPFLTYLPKTKKPILSNN